MKLHFWKIQGTGNDFICINTENLEVPNLSPIAARLADRHFGIGSDGLMSVAKPIDGVFPITMHNPDGSLSGMCGNGIRCITRYLYITKQVAAETKNIKFNFSGRLVECLTIDQGRSVEVELGVANFNPQNIPVDSPTPLRKQPFSIKQGLIKSIDQADFLISTVSVGNPHCVIIVDKLDSIDLKEIGPKIENHPIFPQKANVEFVQVISTSHLRVRVWERNAGITLSCGSGASAVVATLADQGICNPKATVDLPGGSLEIAWDAKTNKVRMKGPAEEVFEGWAEL